ncbi:hypothetical protein HYW44_04255 [Candidatus Daviesbacteria bacterium]|nr:hypothetical protein [Candidatus Daviesbacteria bacterium]
MPDRKAYLNPHIIDILRQVTHPEKGVLFGDIVASPDVLSMTNLRARLCEIRGVSEVPFSSFHKEIDDLTRVGLVTRTGKRGRGRFNMVQATRLGTITYNGLVEASAEIEKAMNACNLTRIVESVPEHLVGDVISRLQQRLHPQNP